MTHYSRAEWGARPAEAKYKLDKAQVEGIALHWPGHRTPLDTTDEVKAALRSWQNYHMDTHGWSDIAYQVAIDQRGNTYGLRGLRYRSGANGDTDLNEKYGALLLVVAVGEAPSLALIREVRDRVATHRRLFPHSRKIVGHQQIRPEPTACPGDKVMALIRAGKFNPKENQ